MQCMMNYRHRKRKKEKLIKKTSIGNRIYYPQDTTIRCKENLYRKCILYADELISKTFVSFG